MIESAARYENIEKALDYLRSEAIDAHLAGDGMRVLHQCTVALRKVTRIGKADTSDQVRVGNVRWAFFLGMYWLLDDWFLHLVKEGLDATAVGDFGVHDRTVIEFLMTTLQTPLNFDSSEKLASLPPDYLMARSQQFEDLAALSLAVEICWYENPADDAWREVIHAWRQHLSSTPPLGQELARLASRLGAQQHFSAGSSEADGDGDEIHTEEWPSEQQWLIKGWRLYLGCDFAQLDSLLTRITPQLRAEGLAYTPFFTLFHRSRMHREEKEDQFLSLSRRNFVISRQPADVCRELRDDRFADAYSEIARRGFPDGVANERFKCFRMAMLNQLHALRSWDIGQWQIGERQRALACLELGARGDLEFARRGVLHAVRSNAVEERGKFPHFDRCATLLDAISEDGRREVVTEILKSPRANWLSVKRVVAQLSDAIPTNVLPDVAAWSVRLELDEYHSRHTISKLEFWGNILHWAPNANRLTAILFTALKERAQDRRCWQILHNTLIATILHAPEATAGDLLFRITNTECSDLHWNEYRFSILYNVAKKRPHFRPECMAWLNDYASGREDAAYQLHVLRCLERGDEEVADDPEFRKWVRKRLLDYCNMRLAEKGPSFNLGGGLAYHRMIQSVKWPRSERKLVSKLIEVIDTDYVPFTNKVEPIYSLAYLARTGPKAQAKQITKAAAKWLQKGIPGRELGIGGPLSVGQISGMGADSVTQPLMLLVDVLVESHPDLIEAKAATWILTEGLRQPINVVGEVICIALNLSIHFQQTEDALGVALVGIAEAAAHSAMHDQPEHVIESFRSVVFRQSPGKLLQEWQRAAAGALCLEMWTRRLADASQLANPSSREAVALTLRKWRLSAVNYPDSLREVEERLKKDPRLRVRFAMKSEPDDSSLD